MRGQAWILAGLAFGGIFATTAQASAQTYGQYGSAYQRDPACDQDRQNRALIGGAIGGLAGAVLGRQVAARNAKTEGAVLGGLAGAAAGAAIGHNTVNCANQQIAQGGYQPNVWDQDRYSQPSGYGTGYGAGQTGYGNDPYYRTGGDDRELRGGPYDGYGSNRGRDCRFGEVITRDPGGREVRDRIYMCRGSDGVWRPS